MKQLIELKPCPLCGCRPVISEIDSYRHGDGGTTYHGKISCTCGLSFEKDWIDILGACPGKYTINIVDEWNELIEKLHNQQKEDGVNDI
jgi:hypothetical protein